MELTLKTESIYFRPPKHDFSFFSNNSNLMEKTKSVYERMFEDKKLFFLGFGVLYITEMRRVKNLVRCPELRITSKSLAETWYTLFKHYQLISPKSKGIRVKDGTYTFGCTAVSLYELIYAVKKLPEQEMDINLRRRLANLTYTYTSPSSKTRIKILKALKINSLKTNELARRIGYSSGNRFKCHLEILQNLGFIIRERVAQQEITNSITSKGKQFISNFEAEIELPPSYTLYNECFKNRQLAADLMLIISELEMGGIMQRNLYLEMTSKDFVEFIFNLCKIWQWTHRNKISKRLHADRKATYICHLNARSVREIYKLSGPCADLGKDTEFRNAASLRKSGVHGKLGETKKNILELIKNDINTSKKIALALNIGIQNIQRPLNELVVVGTLTRQKIGFGYVYRIK